MQTANVTTPFGRRAMTLASVKGQLQSAEAPAGRSVEKWKVFRDVAEARLKLGLQDRAIAVLNALITFYPHNELQPNTSLVVFPSNAQLSIRAHGIAGTTLRRHLAALVESGLIHRRDSPNGKRYVHRSHGGKIEQAFGFDLEPLLRRAAELAELAQQVAEDARSFRRAKETLALSRRDVRKLLSAAVEEGADGDWAEMEAIYLATLAALPRSPTREQVEIVSAEMALLRDAIINRLDLQLKVQNLDANDTQNGCHIQNSHPESFCELEPGSRKELETPTRSTINQQRPKTGEPGKPFPLSMILRACPQIADYGAGGKITTWREMMSAAVVIRSMMGVSTSAYQDACEVMGPENAAAAMACILERANHINCAGGYLRDLTRRAGRSQFSLGPMIMAQLRANAEGTQRRTS